MKEKIILILFLVFGVSLCDGQSWLWGTQGQNSVASDNYGGLVATDKRGNAFEAGTYRDTITFGLLTLYNYNVGLFLTKYNAAGMVQWAKQPTQKSNYDVTYANAIVTDTNSNIYMTGSFGDTVSFGSSTIINKYGHTTVFLAKYDSNGNAIWARQGLQASSSSGGDGSSEAMDGMGNIYVSGMFLDTISFGSNTLISLTGWEDFFLVKYDANGNVIWAKQSKRKSMNSGGEIYSIAADKLGNVYVTGVFSDSLTLGAFTLTSFAYESVPFIAKYDTGGNVLWAEKGNTPSLYSGGSAYAITIDALGNPYIAGRFGDTVIFGSYTLIAHPVNTGVFLAKYDPSGNVLWAEQSSKGRYSGSPNYQLSADMNNHIFMVFGGDDTIGFNGFTFPLPRRDYEEYGCIAELDHSGNVLCGSTLTDMYYYSGNGVASDPSGKYIYTSGTLHDTAIFGPDMLTLQPGNISQPYLARWQSCAIEGIDELTTGEREKVKVFPNPSTGLFTLAFVGAQNFVPATVEIYNVLGEQVLKHILRSTQPARAGTGGDDNRIDLTNQPNGIYFYRVVNNDGSVLGSGKVIIQK